MHIETWWQQSGHKHECFRRYPIHNNSNNVNPVLNDNNVNTVLVQVTTTTTTAASPAQAIFPIQGIQPLGHLDVKENIADNWKTFKQQWNNYAIIMNIHQQPEAYKVAVSSLYRA